MARARETKGRGRPKGSPSKSATFRLPQELLAKLAEAASSQDRSQTILVRRAIEAYLEEKGKGED
jgi:predicted DNA-binding protein